MPELPEVEALRGFLDERLAGRTIEKALPLSVNVLKTYDPPLTSLEDRTVHGVFRHGKFLDLDLGGLHMVVHLARAGWLRWRAPLPAAPARPGKSPLALRVRLAPPPNGHGSDAPGTPEPDGFDLTEAGTQKRLAVYVVQDPQEVPGIARLGPDPLAPDFTRELFAGLLRGRRQQIKGLLRDQGVIAGIGNAYSDEVLHAARMSPFKLADSLTEEEITGLHEAVGRTLREAAERSQGLAAGELKAGKRASMRVHGRTGELCPVCGDTVREVSFRDSSLQYCPTCQTGGRLLADRRMSHLLK